LNSIVAPEVILELFRPNRISNAPADWLETEVMVEVEVLIVVRMLVVPSPSVVVSVTTEVEPMLVVEVEPVYGIIVLLPTI
jgi:hypothetical protein